MKSKKKMLLALGAMSAAAIGAGATSTFAWYKASNSVKVATVSSGPFAVQAGESTISISDVYIKVTIAPSAAVELTDTSGNQGVTVDGNPVTKAGTPADHVKALTLTGAYVDSAGDPTTPSAQQYAALRGKVWANGTFSVAGNAKLMPNATAATDAAAIADDGGRYTISFSDAATPVITVTATAGGYYKINTNNPDGYEAIATPAKTYAASATYEVGEEITYDSLVYKCKTKVTTSTTWETDKTSFFLLGPATATFSSGDYKKGAVVKHSTKYYRCTADKDGSADPASEGGYWSEVKLHSEDKITVQAISAQAVADPA